MASSERRLKEVAVMGRLTSPQAISFSLIGSLTMDLEAGERLNREMITLFWLLRRRRKLHCLRFCLVWCWGQRVHIRVHFHKALQRWIKIKVPKVAGDVGIDDAEVLKESLLGFSEPE